LLAATKSHDHNSPLAPVSAPAGPSRCLDFHRCPSLPGAWANMMNRRRGRTWVTVNRQCGS